MAENDLCGLYAVFLADLGGCGVAELVRGPVGDAGFSAGTGDGLAVGVGGVMVAEAAVGLRGFGSLTEAAVCGALCISVGLGLSGAKERSGFFAVVHEVMEDLLGFGSEIDDAVVAVMLRLVVGQACEPEAVRSIDVAWAKSAEFSGSGGGVELEVDEGAYLRRYDLADLSDGFVGGRFHGLGFGDSLFAGAEASDG